jgi:hypothetical protein
MIRPMLTNYLNALSTALTNDKALDFCKTVRQWLDYVEYGTVVDES